MSFAAQRHISTRMKQVKLSRFTRWIHVTLLPQQILSATGSSGRSRIFDANSTPTTKDLQKPSAGGAEHPRVRLPRIPCCSVEGQASCRAPAAH